MRRELYVSNVACIKPRCPYVGRCGGCRLQHVPYPEQLAGKAQALRQALAATLDDLPLEVIGAPEPWRYRNKAELTFSAADGELTLGYHASGSFRRVIDIDDCLLLPEPLNGVMRTLKRLARASGRPAYQPTTHQGFFRHALLRQSRATGQVLVCLITARGDRAPVERLADQLLAAHPDVGSVWWGVTERFADVALPEAVVAVRGTSDITERLGEFTLRLSPLAFLQPNLVQAERMYDTLLQWLAPSPTGVAWDCYCGVGAIGLYLARRFGRVHGIDSEACNVEAARLNAEANGVANVTFHAGRAEAVFADKRFWLGEGRPEVVVVDPPRAGLHAQVIGALLSARPAQIAYISCNPVALARDLAVLRRGFPRYRARRACAFDLFPHTPHVETVVLLER